MFYKRTLNYSAHPHLPNVLLVPTLQRRRSPLRIDLSEAGLEQGERKGGLGLQLQMNIFLVVTL